MIQLEVDLEADYTFQSSGHKQYLILLEPVKLNIKVYCK